jgi:hypothetical protein
MKVTLDLDALVRDQRITAAEAERLTDLACSQPSVRQTRGLWSIAVPTMIGIIVGELVGAVVLVDTVLAQVWGPDRAILVGVLEGGLIGALVGAGIGVFRWAFFPYTRDSPSEATSGRPGSPDE